VSRPPGEPTRVTGDQVRWQRMRAQRLTGPRPAEVAGVVRAVAGLQAQDTPASRLAVRARSTGLDQGAVRRACDRDRSVVRTWAMRGSLHMVAAEDVGWLVALLGPTFAAAGRRRRLQLGLDEEVCERALDALPAVLADGPLSRAELVRALAANGVRVEPTGQAPAHLVGYAALRGLVCRGPDLDGDEPSYVLLEDWVGAGRGGPRMGRGGPGDRRGVPPFDRAVHRAPDPDDALAELARRYLGGHGPAAPEDLAAWSGLPVGRARHAFELAAGGLREVELGGRRLWTAGGAPAPAAGSTATGPVVRLLGRFDDYLLGWRGRDLILEASFARRIQAGGWIHPALVVDGRVAGSWRARRTGDRLEVAVEPFGDRLPRGILPALEAEAADLGRFLGLRPALRLDRR
jgi:Winged helix DNA-binding domain